MHKLNGWGCTCEPEIKVVCIECDDPNHPDPDCWACGGNGLMDATDRPPDENRLVIHRPLRLRRCQ